MKFLDVPPIWLAVFAGLAWMQSRYLGADVSFGFAASRTLGTTMILIGVVLIALAAFALFKGHTTIVPHKTPTALVDTGVFGMSRNPIYLADALILSGLVLRWDAVLSLILVPAFMGLIAVRFITPEEGRMRDSFGEEFIDYERKVRRWI